MLQNVAQSIINIFKFHKLKLFTVFLSAVICLLWLFPYEDLTDLVTEEVAKATNNQVFITFDDLNLSIFPAVGLDMTRVKLDLKKMPSIEVKALSFSPSVTSLITKKVGFSAHLDGLLDGDVKIAVKPSGETADKTPIHNIELDADNIQLSQVKKFVKMPVELKTRANLEFNADVDHKFVEQPDGELSLITKKLKLPATSLPTAYGEMPFPEMTFDKFILKGRLTAGELIVEQLELGSPKDPLSVRLKGSMGLKLLGSPDGIKPSPGKYKLKVEINSNARDNKDLQLFLGFLDSYKKASGTSDKYLLRVEAPRFGVTPNMSKLNKYD